VYKTYVKACTPKYTMETYDKHGRLQKVELLRTLTAAEFAFEVERAQLPVAEVTVDTGPAYPAGTYDNCGNIEAV
jgi:hypothetical protein